MSMKLSNVNNHILCKGSRDTIRTSSATQVTETTENKSYESRFKYLLSLQLRKYH